MQLKGYQVPRGIVQLLLKNIDPDGYEMQRSHRLKRRIYRNEGPNAAWHADGYDKLKPYGFAIHGCIDGWSRKLLWLIVTRSNNYPDNIAIYFMDTVEKYGGCPVKLITDMGTENSTMAAIQCFSEMTMLTVIVPLPEINELKGFGPLFEECARLGGLIFLKI